MTVFHISISYTRYSDTFRMVKMESVSKITMFGQKMVVKSDCDRNNMKNLRKNRDKVWYIKAFLLKGFAYTYVAKPI